MKIVLFGAGGQVGRELRGTLQPLGDRALRAWLAGDLGNTGLWVALLVFLGARGLGQAALYPRLARQSFAEPAVQPSLT
jgi:hypothetical protein